MTSEITDLEKLNRKLIDFLNDAKRSDVCEPVDQLEDSALETGKSWSRSWLGYHSRVYYENFSTVPADAIFSSEWGFINALTGSVGDWVIYEFDKVIENIQSTAGNPDISKAEKLSKQGRELFTSTKYEVISILESLSDRFTGDSFIQKISDEIDDLKVFSGQDFLETQMPKGKVWSRDTKAISQGIIAPPHVVVLSWVFSIRDPSRACRELFEKIRAMISHVERVERSLMLKERVGTNVFIGHSQNPVWREFKDFIQERCSLPYDEFNRVPVAGVTNISRLSEMLDSAAIAFLILTAEDEQVDGSFNARLNVIHEAGLFQGRLGFSKAILLLEDGCNEFSNVNGLGQIRFPKGEIKAAFEEVRRVLEREGLLD